MALPDESRDTAPTRFYVGQHEDNRILPVTQELLDHARDYDYDMLTAPITNSHFHSRVLTLLSTHRSMTNDSNGMKPFRELSSPLIPPLSYLDTSLTPNSAVAKLLLMASSWIDLTSADPVIADISEQVMNLEIAYASFCGACNIIVPGPRCRNAQGLTRYARALLRALHTGPYVNIHLSLDMYENSNFEAEAEMGNLSLFADEILGGETGQKVSVKPAPFSVWDVWNLVRSICGYNVRLFVVLNIPPHLPSAAVQSRWFSEPVRIIRISSKSFLRNAKGFPVLSKSQQQLISRYSRIRPTPWIILSEVGPIPDVEAENQDYTLSGTDPTPAEAMGNSNTKPRKPEDPTPHLSYIRHLEASQPQPTPIERFGADYQDYLQNPLQPLADNLESVTYEVFEKDPVKYEWYERAIALALKDWKKKGLQGSGLDGVIVVAVAGAGRGPLVTRAIRASASANVTIDLWAVEKNPSAFVVLQRHNLDDWDDRVSLVQSDMRSWRGPEYTTRSSTAGTEVISTTITKVDILISELLGSFGDNELSPECLDGIQHVLNPAHGISIPASYTAHVTPIASPKIYANILARIASDPEATQTPYVVMLHAIDFLSTTAVIPKNALNTSIADAKDAKPVLQPVVLQAWEFKHSQSQDMLSQPENRHNTRFANLNFPCKDRGTCHGIAGYFETVLYAQAIDSTEENVKSSIPSSAESSSPAVAVELSINPLTIDKKSKDMISWFPMFFPLKTPLYFPDNSELNISMWRQTDGRKVWYEWIIEAFSQLGDTRTGRDPKVRVAASELHTSEKNGCLL